MSSPSPAIKGNHLPTPTQKLLLKTILGPSGQLIRNWHQWQQAVALDDIDHGSFRIIPMLSHLLRQQSAEGPDIKRYAGMCRKAWYSNKLIFHPTAQLIRQWKSEGRELAVLKGLALAHLYYPDPALRPMDDVDILVPPDQAVSTIDWFFENGWKHNYDIPHQSLVKYSVQKEHSVDMKHSSGHTVDAHWQPLRYPMPRDLIQELWDAMITVEIMGLPVKTLCPTDQLLHTCIHGFSWNRVPPLRWIMDAHMILKKDGDKVDWQRFTRFTTQLHLAPIAGAALKYLQEEYDEPIPAAVVNHLCALPWQEWQKIEFQTWTDLTPSNHLHYFLHIRYQRLQATLPDWAAKSRWRAKCDFLKIYWELDSDTQLLGYLLRRSGQKIRAKVAH